MAVSTVFFIVLRVFLSLLPHFFEGIDQTIG